MTDAQTLLREGIAAIRDRQDRVAGRDLLARALKLDPRSDAAWLWLTHTTDDPQQQRVYVERALAINPGNPPARDLRDRLDALALEPSTSGVIRPLKAEPQALTETQNTRILALLDEAEVLQANGAVEDALARWEDVLAIQPDNAIAIRGAVGHLWRLGYPDDAKELIGRALLNGTSTPSIYLTALDIAERDADDESATRLRARVAALPTMEEDALLTLADRYAQNARPDRAAQFLEQALAVHPDRQALMVRLGDLLCELGRIPEARRWYEGALRVSPHSKAGRDADERLLAFGPSLDERERRSMWLAVREAAGLTFVYLMLAWQDSSLSLLSMDAAHWAGVLVALAGSYLLVTATSSPQQQPLAAWLDGSHARTLATGRLQSLGPTAYAAEPALPTIPPAIRAGLGIAGTLLLLIALALVLGQSIDLLQHYSPPPLPVF
ncbi:tetratricopeptide repeat protein [Aggregatilinea lenta]|uniref:tetratricopeptide repeat protein n=1 Tax=Aggregatilinea lenta TaxID=913108 RepID=UPI000E5B8297|nr:tetratricopeptide repeat protein [Aggregatilinea lenta]